MKKNEASAIIAVLGCGNMAQAMLGGLVGTSIDAQYYFHCSSRSMGSAVALSERFQSANAMIDNVQAVKDAVRIILSIKPQQAKQVCEEIAPNLSSDCHIISVMAGISVETLSKWCGVSNISRIMPNTPALIGQGVLGIYHHDSVNSVDQTFVREMSDNVGFSMVLDDEQKMHLITAISGSGPAYFFHFIHHMQQAAIKLGFSAEEACELVNHTALGASKMVMHSDDSALALQQKVCSPGGTTEQAIKSFEGANMENIIDQAVNACYQRSVELSKSS